MADNKGQFTKESNTIDKRNSLRESAAKIASECKTALKDSVELVDLVCSFFSKPGLQAEASKVNVPCYQTKPKMAAALLAKGWTIPNEDELNTTWQLQSQNASFVPDYSEDATKTGESKINQLPDGTQSTHSDETIARLLDILSSHVAQQGAINAELLKAKQEEKDDTLSSGALSRSTLNALARVSLSTLT